MAIKIIRRALLIFIMQQHFPKDRDQSAAILPPDHERHDRQHAKSALMPSIMKDRPQALPSPTVVLIRSLVPRKGTPPLVAEVAPCGIESGPGGKAWGRWAQRHRDCETTQSRPRVGLSRVGFLTANIDRAMARETKTRNELADLVMRAARASGECPGSSECVCHGTSQPWILELAH